MLEDKRIIKTKRNIEKTFQQLLQRMPFEKITVKLLIEEALINKGTFYAHYLDKYDLVGKITTAYLEKFKTSLLERRKLLQDNGSYERVLYSFEESFQDIQKNFVWLSKLSPSILDIDKELLFILQQEIAAGFSERGQAAGTLDMDAALMAQISLEYLRYQSQQKKPVSFIDYLESVHRLSGIVLNSIKATKD